jgi:hypothetical protein
MSDKTPPPLYVVVCADGSRCRGDSEDYYWPNATEFKDDAENDVLRLDNWIESKQGKQFAGTPDSKELMEKYPEFYEPESCGPHRVVEYRPVMPEVGR